MNAFLSGLVVGASNKATEIIEEERLLEQTREDNIAANIAKRRNARNDAVFNANLKLEASAAKEMRLAEIEADKMLADQDRFQGITTQIANGEISSLADVSVVAKDEEELNTFTDLLVKSNPDAAAEMYNNTRKSFESQGIDSAMSGVLAAEQVFGVKNITLQQSQEITASTQAADERTLANASISFDQFSDTYDLIFTKGEGKAISFGNRMGLTAKRLFQGIVPDETLDGGINALLEWTGNQPVEDTIKASKALGASLVRLVPTIAAGDTRYSDNERRAAVDFLGLGRGLQSGDVSLTSSPKEIKAALEGAAEMAIKDIYLRYSGLPEGHPARNRITERTRRALNIYENKILNKAKKENIRESVNPITAAERAYIDISKTINAARASNNITADMKQQFINNSTSFINTLTQSRNRGELSQEAFDTFVNKHQLRRINPALK
jgi:hypothetical protein